MAVIDRDFGAADLAAMLAGTEMDAAVVVQASNSLDESLRLARLDSPAIAGLVGAGRWKLALEDLLRGASDDDRRRIFGDTAAEVYSLG